MQTVAQKSSPFSAFAINVVQKMLMTAIPCSIIRGGTSKGVYFLENDLPQNQALRDRVICAAFGGVDPRQIDGLGGADTLTSKVAIIGPSDRADCDISYTFGQVSFVEPIVDYKGNCGNISAGVGPFAIDKGLVKAVEPETTVRIYLTNTDNVIVETVPVKNGHAQTEGDFAIDGVPGTGAKITLDFSDTQGAITGHLLPTGHPIDILDFGDKGCYEVSIVDAGNPLVFIEAKALGLRGTEKPSDFEGNPELMERIEMIRSRVAVMLGLAASDEKGIEQSPYVPFFAIVSPAADYNCYTGKRVRIEDVDIVSRLIFMQRVHKTYPGTGTVCTGAASKIPGTIVWRQLSEQARKSEILRIGHFAGVIETEVNAEEKNGNITLTKAAFYRTARKIMDGVVYVRNKVFQSE